VVTVDGLGVKPRCDRNRLHYQVRREAQASQVSARHGSFAGRVGPGSQRLVIFGSANSAGRIAFNAHQALPTIFCAR